ncbi:MAG: hypothetical protein KAX49_16570, partial [Halanaerobiales bacterium]|nr:hypothetical protein [Halanaerobiales bacterium]
MIKSFHHKLLFFASEPIPVRKHLSTVRSNYYPVEVEAAMKKHYDTLTDARVCELLEKEGIKVSRYIVQQLFEKHNFKQRK